MSAYTPLVAGTTFPAWCDSPEAHDLIRAILASAVEPRDANEFEAPEYPGKHYRALDRLYTDHVFSEFRPLDEIAAIETPFKLVSRLIEEARS